MSTKRAVANRKNARKPRISRRLRRAIELMVFEGLSRPLAAERAGMTDSGLYQALRRSHVRSLLAQHFNDLKDGETVRAYFRQVELGEAANSEDVRERANRFVAGIGGLAPVSKVHVRGEHHHRFEGIGFAPRPAIDGQAEDVQDAEPVEPEAVEIVDETEE